MFSTSTLYTAGLWSLFILPSFGAVHEQLVALPNGWTKVGTPDESSTITLKIGLQEQNLDQLESLVYGVSTPGSATYGKHMDRDDVSAILQPSSDSNTAVLDWLKQAGITNLDSDGTWITFATTVGTANKLLDSDFNYYENDGVTKLRTMGYSIPDSLSSHIDLVTPTTYFGKTTANAPLLVPSKERIAARQVAPSCANLITPACIKELYNINYTPDPNSGSKIAFGSFLNQSARVADLQAFETAQGIPQQGFSVELINGGVNDQAIDDNHGEANLDVEYIIGTSHPLPVISYITGGSP